MGLLDWMPYRSLQHVASPETTRNQELSNAPRNYQNAVPTLGPIALRTLSGILRQVHVPHGHLAVGLRRVSSQTL